MEKREKSRVPFHLKAIFDYKGETIKGKLDNLSMNGMFIKTDRQIPENSKINVTIELSGDTSKLSINITGTVIRYENDGIALTFNNLDLDSFIHLKNIISYNLTEENGTGA